MFTQTPCFNGYHVSYSLFREKEEIKTTTKFFVERWLGTFSFLLHVREEQKMKSQINAKNKQKTIQNKSQIERQDILLQDTVKFFRWTCLKLLIQQQLLHAFMCVKMTCTFFRRNLNRKEVLLNTIRAVTVRKNSRAEQTQFIISSRLCIKRPSRVRVGQLSPLRTVFDTRSTCVEQSQVFVSPRRHFLRPELGGIVRYSLLELLLSN